VSVTDPRGRKRSLLSKGELKMSWLSTFRSCFEGATESYRNIEEGREMCVAGTHEAEAGFEASIRVKTIIRKMVDDTMSAPLCATNLSDRWAILQLTIEVFGLADADVGRVAVAFGLEAEMAAATD
jgi:hypothetical protein